MNNSNETNTIQDIIRLLQLIEVVGYNTPEEYETNIRPKIKAILDRLDANTSLKAVSELNHFDWNEYVSRWLGPYEFFINEKHDY